MMSNSKKERSEKQIVVRFIILLVICAIIGYLMGVGSITLSKQKFDFQAINNAMFWASTALYTVVNIVGFILVAAMSINQERRYRNWNGEDEDILDDIEKKLNIPMSIGSVAQIINMMLFPVILWLSDRAKYNNYLIAGVAFVTVILFVFGLVWVTFFQNYQVKLIKEMNPEKKGSVLEMDFQKKWVESCDEAQKLSVYKCGFAAYKAANLTCLTLWVVSVITMFAFDTGIFPIICVCVIHLALIGAYSITAIKLE